MRFSATLAALAVLMTAGCTTPAAHHSTPHIDPNLRVAPNPTRAPEVSSVSVDFQLPLDEAGYFMVDPARLSGFTKQYNSVGEGQLTLHIPEWAVYARAYWMFKICLRMQVFRQRAFISNPIPHGAIHWHDPF